MAGSADASLLSTSPAGEKEKRRGGGLRNVLERIGNSYIVQRTLELQVVTRAIDGVSNTPIALEVAIEQLEGDLVIHIPPPPSDRLWYLTNIVQYISTVHLCLFSYIYVPLIRVRRYRSQKYGFILILVEIDIHE